ncbi:hypothetical protein ACFQZ4_24135 [Catellatospora coxensis]|uniref:Uncharacterized protein n=1 Tax=Catellatospora coxensis TaxID=310354 RepID=A0A8J3L831_9ACTN|nr:hypothetical protein [Catellatospora coxensis]GIG10206.1 hypothetical protein Cco03nite_69060 [Catellatospora coxensis]
MAELLLVDTETDAERARLTLDGDEVRYSGEDADLARDILRDRARARDVTEAEAFRQYRRWGWANGPLALRTP